MTSDRWQGAQDILDEATALSPEASAALVTEACGDDAELRAEVESLLEHHRRASADFLRPLEPGTGIRQPAALDEPDPLIGTAISQFRIEAVIAAGGMGTVYLARQEHPQRKVALKVMRAGVASSSALKRFEYEAQVLARLRHPNIAQIYEAGTHHLDPIPDQQPSPDLDPSRDREGAGSFPSPDRKGAGQPRTVPYFAREYIPGARTITDYARGNNLTTHERLELFAQVCEAVHHGHQKGIIHRDLKPGNILVEGTEGEAEGAQARRHTGTKGREGERSSSSLSAFAPLREAQGEGTQAQRHAGTTGEGKDSLRSRHAETITERPTAEPGRVKIIDFGVARSTDSDVAVTTRCTDVGQLIGTLQYMSPEQCDADPHDLDIRSDVYALGVVLFELLCDRLPYDVTGVGLASAARVICEQSPPALGAVDRRLRGDLEWIALKALEKDRERRYQSAADLLRDIRHYLNREPIEAKPPTPWEA